MNDVHVFPNITLKTKARKRLKFECKINAKKASHENIKTITSFCTLSNHNCHFLFFFISHFYLLLPSFELRFRLSQQHFVFIYIQKHFRVFVLCCLCMSIKTHKRRQVDVRIKNRRK